MACGGRNEFALLAQAVKPSTHNARKSRNSAISAAQGSTDGVAGREPLRNSGKELRGWAGNFAQSSSGASSGCTCGTKTNSSGTLKTRFGTIRAWARRNWALKNAWRWMHWRNVVRKPMEPATGLEVSRCAQLRRVGHSVGDKPPNPHQKGPRHLKMAPSTLKVLTYIIVAFR